MKIILSVSDLLDYIIKKIIAVLLMAMTAILFSQVIARYLMGSGLSWSEELVRYMCVWVIFMGSTCAAKDGSQIAVTVLDETLKGMPKKILNITQSIIVAAYTILLCWIGFSTLGIAKTQMSPNMELPMNIVYSVIPLSMIVMLIHLVAVFMKNRKAAIESQE
ncbi:MAG: TRAP transporter small permease [Sedimentibacter sp.]